MIGGAGSGARGPEGGRAGIFPDDGRTGNEGLVGGPLGPDGGPPPTPTPPCPGPGPSNRGRLAGG